MKGEATAKLGTKTPQSMTIREFNHTSHNNGKSPEPSPPISKEEIMVLPMNLWRFLLEISGGMWFGFFGPPSHPIFGKADAHGFFKTKRGTRQNRPRFLVCFFSKRGNRSAIEEAEPRKTRPSQFQAKSLSHFPPSPVEENYEKGKTQPFPLVGRETAQRRKFETRFPLEVIQWNWKSYPPKPGRWGQKNGF